MITISTMMMLKFIKSSQKKAIVEKLKEQFGITELPYLLIESGKEKTRAFSGHLSKEEILKIAEIAHVEVIGLYLLKEENNELRLSHDAVHLLKEQITRNIIEVKEEQALNWLRGHDLDIKANKGSVIIKFQDDFIGCGKSNGDKIFNYVPKDRRLKK